MSFDDSRNFAAALVIGGLCGLLPPDGGGFRGAALTVLWILIALTIREAIAWGIRAFMRRGEHVVHVRLNGLTADERDAKIRKAMADAGLAPDALANSTAVLTVTFPAGGERS